MILPLFTCVWKYGHKIPCPEFGVFALKPNKPNFSVEKNGNRISAAKPSRIYRPPLSCTCARRTSDDTRNRMCLQLPARPHSTNITLSATHLKFDAELVGGCLLQLLTSSQCAYLLTKQRRLDHRLQVGVVTFVGVL